MRRETIQVIAGRQFIFSGSRVISQGKEEELPKINEFFSAFILGLSPWQRRRFVGHLVKCANPTCPNIFFLPQWRAELRKINSKIGMSCSNRCSNIINPRLNCPSLKGREVKSS
ncbi:MAG: hypothetical protein Q7K28_02760 [Candidatus Wildermuthbacteria bacterium]|nr:hypothetical protein [Candidatus Wildermuthbacteria bacterium]